MFIGRKQELESLNNIYKKSGFGMTVIYGRRRIGKSTLIAEFKKMKRLFFSIVGYLYDEPGNLLAQEFSDVSLVIDRSFVAGECKFKNEKMDKNVYETLVRRTRNISGKYKLQKYVFFSLGGYTEWFDTVTDSNVILFTLEDMY